MGSLIAIIVIIASIAITPTIAIIATIPIIAIIAIIPIIAIIAIIPIIPIIAHNSDRPFRSRHSSKTAPEMLRLHRWGAGGWGLGLVIGKEPGDIPPRCMRRVRQSAPLHAVMQ